MLAGTFITSCYTMMWLRGVGQTVAIVFWIATAVYALLASQPFSYEQFLRPAILPLVSQFARLHPVISVAVLGFYLVCNVAAQPEKRAGQIALGIVGGVWGLAAIALFVIPALADLTPGRTAEAVVFVALVPVLLIAAVDLTVAEPTDTSAPQSRHASDFFACVLAAVLAWALTALVSVTRGAWAQLPGELAAAILTSAILHLVLFLALFLCLTAVRAVAAMTRSRRVEIAGTTLLLAAALFLVFSKFALAGLMSPGLMAGAVAAAFAVTLAAAVAARGLARSDEFDDSAARVMSALAPRATEGSWAWLTVWVVGVGAVFAVLIAASDVVDWSSTLARLSVVLAWLLVLAAVIQRVRTPQAGEPAAFFVLAALVLGLHMAWMSGSAEHALSSAGIDRESGLRTWTARDPAARLLTESLRAPANSTDPALGQLLQQHTNIAATVNVQPVAVSLAPLNGTPAPYRPHIFLFVIDSLRRDYVGAFNQAVSFTPAIDAFAKESVIFPKAFTRYGATGLSVPSIWVGGMLLHKQYVTPFAPMNSLAQLVEDQKYAQWIGMDSVMEAILPASETRQPLDDGRSGTDVRLCTTLDEVRTRLAARKIGDPPVFVYTLPQDVHTSTLAREGNTVVDQQHYGSFFGPVASRIRRFDQCFGAFIADLKEKNLFADSIIILTSDHGDSLGEEGRMGHAYTLYPEVVQIPLIVRVPTSMLTERHAETEGVAFSLDITPTIYSLLGFTPTQPHPFFGTPLFRPRERGPRNSVQPPPVLASSYGPVYGALLSGGNQLYIFDTVNSREHSFTLDGSGSGRPVTTTPELRSDGQKAIRSTVELVARFYGFFRQ